MSKLKLNNTVEDFLEGKLSKEKKQSFLNILSDYKTAYDHKKREVIDEEYNESDATNSTHLTHLQIKEFFDETISVKQKVLIEKHLKECTACYKRYIHSSSQDIIIQNEKVNSEIIKEYDNLNSFILNLKKIGNFFSKIYRQVFIFVSDVNNTIRIRRRVKLSYGFGVLATIAVGIVLIFRLTIDFPLKNNALDSQLVISNIGPFGLMEDTNVLKYKGMFISLSEDKANLIFHWPKIQDSEFYEIHLVVISERTRITPFQGIQETSFKYDILNIIPTEEYFWELSGKLTNNRRFFSRAKFTYEP